MSTNFKTLTVNKLRELCREANLKVGGKKETLISRLRQHEKLERNDSNINCENDESVEHLQQPPTKKRKITNQTKAKSKRKDKSNGTSRVATLATHRFNLHLF